MSPELHAARCGNITASRIVDVMMKKDAAGYRNYLAELVTERLTGRQEEGFTTKDMQWGNECEPIARAAYEADTGLFVSDGGYVQHPTIKRSGASPDGLVGADGLIEIKCRKTAQHLVTITEGKIKREQQLQMQWQMACTGRLWCDSVSFDPRMPYHLQLNVIRVAANPELIAEIAARVAEFDSEVEAMLCKLQKAAA